MILPRPHARTLMEIILVLVLVLMFVRVEWVRNNTLAGVFLTVRGVTLGAYRTSAENWYFAIVGLNKISR